MRFGISSRDITPPFPTSMGGYGARQDHFDGVHDRLALTSLLLEDEGKRAVIVSADISTWPNDGRTERLITQLATLVGTTPAHILLNASHTHGGPKMPGTATINRRRGDFAAAERYADWLAEQTLTSVEEALARRQTGSLQIVRGKTTLPMNRRRLENGEIINAPNPDGPVDDGMQVLTVRDARDRVAAVAMRLSCHPVATGAQHLITADFVGGWREVFRESFGPNVTPMFLQGAAGDMRPRHAADGSDWRKMAHREMRDIGRELVAEMLQAMMAGPQQSIDRLTLNGALEISRAHCVPLYTTPESVTPLLNHPRAFERDFANTCLTLFRQNRPPQTSVDFRVQTLWLDDEIALVGLNCEPLHGLGHAIEKAFAPRSAIVLGYTNGCVCYTPDTPALQRGGYEAESYLFEPYAGPWRQGFEQTFRPHLLTEPRLTVAIAG